MNLNHLRVFAAIGAEGSITGAARSLKISQPAVSKQLAELESALGTSLVDRLPRGARLTAAGQVLYKHAQRIFGTERVAEAELAELLGLTRGKLTIGASTSIGSYLVPRVLGEFHKRYPKIELLLEIANTRVIQEAVLEDRIDLGLTEGLVSGEALEVEVIAHDEMVVIVAPGDPMAAAVAVPAKRLTEVPFIMRERGSGSRDVIEAALEARGIRIEPVMSLGSTEAVKNAVAQGLGVAMVSQLTVGLELTTGQLQAVPLSDLTVRRALHLITLRGKRPSPASAVFIEQLRQQEP